MYSQFDVELNIYRMAEDVAEISDVMEESVRFRRQFIDRWMMTLWAGILLITLTVIFIPNILKEKMKNEESHKKKRLRYGNLSSPSQLIDLLKEEAHENAVLDRFSHNEQDEVTLIPVIGNEQQLCMDVSLKVVKVQS